MELIDDLNDNRKIKTGYQKLIERYDEVDEPEVSGFGFLFNNSLLNKVKERLEGNVSTAANQKSSPVPDNRGFHNYDGEDVEDGLSGVQRGHFTALTFHIPEKSLADSETQHIVTSPKPETNSFDASNKSDSPDQTVEVLNSSEITSKTQAITNESQENPTQADERVSQKDAKLTNVLDEIVDSADDEEADSLQPCDQTIPESLKVSTSVSTQHWNVRGIMNDRNLNVATADSSLNHIKFIEEFDNSSESDSEVTVKPRTHVSPDHSPGNIDRRRYIGSSNASDENRGQTPQHLRSYHRKLKASLQVPSGVELEDSSDDENPRTSYSVSSKAAILRLRARLSRGCKETTQPKTSACQNKLKGLFSDLRLANKAQIRVSHEEKYKEKGLNIEDIEKEKIEVENLLEIELSRNKRIRWKEIKREKMREREEDRAFSSDSLASSDNEIQTDSDGHDVQPLTDSNQADANDGSCAGTSSEGDSSDEEMDLIRVKKGKNTKISLLSEEEEEDKNTKAIIIGSYGNEDLDLLSDRSNLRLTNKNPPPARRANKIYESVPSHESEGTADGNHLNKSEMLNRALAEKKWKLKKENLRNKERFRSSGVQKMLETEAVESEDEWYGVGGLDGEDSGLDDSELEGLIDDMPLGSATENDAARMINEQSVISDQNMVNRILKDIKSGGFRRKANGFSKFDISDEEDEDLQNYHAKRRKLLKEGVFGSVEHSNIASNSKCKAFFESMIEEPFMKNSLIEPGFASHDVKSKSCVPDQISEPALESENAKHIQISQEFVQKSLSFLGPKSDNEITDNRSSTMTPPFDGNRGSSQCSDMNALKSCLGIKSFFKNSRSSEEYNEETQSVTMTFTPLIQLSKSHTHTTPKFREGMRTFKSTAARNLASHRRAITFMTKRKQNHGFSKEGRALRSAYERGQRLQNFANTSTEFFS
ncbi:LAMI_0F00298g1_1 [Lachancea mirantina]|uniref:LAMI_0F00298g1_1 n=1 Tax=Lachancea mirantina TaxID=1230905 RepID=A0A1G4JVP5_9SACH|nr:LAMI_0F00298g1_1 [Lachancea mirantina]